MSNSLYKAGHIVYKRDEKRVIDSNQMISDRMRVLTEILESVPTEDDFEAFSEGLDAEQVEQLFGDSDAQPEESEYSEEAMAGANPELLQQAIDDANAKAEEILANANAEAERIINDANAEAEQIRSNARDAGHSEGYDRGYNEGLAKAHELENEVEAKHSAMLAEYEEKISQLEPRFVETLTDIYSHVFKVDLSDKTELILYLLKDAIRNIDGGKSFMIHVSKDDFPTVSSEKDNLIAGKGSHVTVEIIEDITLSAGECFVEADGGIFDCSIDTELELLKKKLVLLSYQQD